MKWSNSQVITTMTTMKREDAPKRPPRPITPAIRQAMAYLENTDFSAVAPGKYEIDGSRMFCIVSESTTRGSAEFKAKSHSLYIDIPYLIAGEEKIGFARLTLMETDYE
jgi:YhcH/YjgK/YiaL family protein